MTSRAAQLALSPVLIAALVAACGGDEGGNLQEPNPVAVVNVSAPTTRIRVGETVQLTATALDADGNVLEDREFTWTSGIGTVASVSADGLVTGRVKGASEIRATTEGVTGTLVITVDVPLRGDPFQREPAIVRRQVQDNHGRGRRSLVLNVHQSVGEELAVGLADPPLP
jgi:hypothetical protein